MKQEKNSLKVSYVLGIYNAERTLKECINGILMQDYPKADYEIIIVDGGSNDKTLDICREFMKKNKNIKLLHNSAKLSEGRGMSKDIGVNASEGKIIIFLDHDNIILHKDWLEKILYPFKDKKIMASQSFLQYRENDSNFLKYVNAIGVEDPFAVPHSIVAQAVIYPKKFTDVENKYLLFKLDRKNILFGGANGGAFRKEVFRKIGGYTRDVDVYAEMAEYNMNVAVVKDTKIYHDTSNNLFNFLKKKGLYFYRFIDKEYKSKKFQWIPKDFRGKLKFYLMIAGNLSIVYPAIVSLKQVLKTRRLFWLLHSGYVFFITLEYGIITLLKMRNFFEYGKKN